MLRDVPLGSWDSWDICLLRGTYAGFGRSRQKQPATAVASEANRRRRSGRWSHVIHDDNPTDVTYRRRRRVKALLHQSIEDCAAEEHIIPESAAIAAIADVSHAPQLFPSETDTAANQPVVSEGDDHLAARRAIIHEWENWSALHTGRAGRSQRRQIFLRAFAEEEASPSGFRLRRWMGSGAGWLGARLVGRISAVDREKTRGPRLLPETSIVA